MKSHLRFSRASGSQRRKVERLIAQGWAPGVSIRKRTRNKKESAGCREATPAENEFDEHTIY
jgi:hypothetical protein